MSISSINDTYNRLMSSVYSKPAESASSTGSSSLTGSASTISSTSATSSISSTGTINSADGAAESNTSSGADILELGSSDSSPFLNYGSSGYYNNLSLIDLLNGSSDNNNLSALFDTETGNDNVITSFNKIVEAKSKEIDDLISKAISRLKGLLSRG